MPISQSQNENNISMLFNCGDEYKANVDPDSFKINPESLSHKIVREIFSRGKIYLRPETHKTDPSFSIRLRDDADLQELNRLLKYFNNYKDIGQITINIKGESYTAKKVECNNWMNGHLAFKGGITS